MLSAFLEVVILIKFQMLCHKDTLNFVRKANLDFGGKKLNRKFHFSISPKRKKIIFSIQILFVVEVLPGRAITLS